MRQASSPIFIYNKQSMLSYYLVIKSIRFGEIQYVDFNGLALGASPSDVFAIDTEIEPLLMTAAVGIESH
jgi:hypothetical protein